MQHTILNKALGTSDQIQEELSIQTATNNWNETEDINNN